MFIYSNKIIKVVKKRNREEIEVELKYPIKNIVIIILVGVGMRSTQHNKKVLMDAMKYIITPINYFS